MKKTLLSVIAVFLFTGIVIAQTAPDNGSWQTRRPDWTKDKYTYQLQEGINLIMRRLCPYVSSYYAIEVVISSQNGRVQVFGNVSVIVSSGTSSITIFCSSNTASIMTVPYDYNMYYSTHTGGKITNASATTITIPFETNLISITSKGNIHDYGNVDTSFGSSQNIPDGIPISIPAPYYAVNPQIRFSALDTMATYYYMATGRTLK